MKKSDIKLNPIAAKIRFMWKHSTHPVFHMMHRLLESIRPAKILICENGDVRIAYVGNQKGISHGFTFLSDQLEADAGPLNRSLKSVYPWRKQYWIQRLSAETDMIMVGGSPGITATLAPDGYVMPMRVHYNVELNAETEPEKMLSKQTRKNYLRDLSRSGWDAELSRKEEDFWFFYEKMHLPTMQNRHGEQTRTDDLNVAFNELFRKGFVFFLTQNGVRNAGVVCREYSDRKVISMRLAGVLNADDAFYQDGSFLALYVFLIRWAHENGYCRVELSGSEPFISKGLHQFKRTLGPSLMNADNQYAPFVLGLRTNGTNPHIRSLLVRNPLIEFCEGNFSGPFRGVFFREEGSPAWKRGWKTVNLEKEYNVWLPVKDSK